MRSALVVGGSGFLGLPTVRRLASHGYQVYATYRANRYLPAIPNVSWLPIDFTLPNPTAKWPTRCDYLIYLSQSRRSGQFPENATDVFQVNVQGLMQSLNYARQHHVRCAVMATSGDVYRNTNAPAKETDTISLQGDRDFATKAALAAELLASAYAAELPIVQLRVFLPYGPGQAGDRFMSNLVQRIQQGQAISLQGRDGILTNPLFALDAAAAIERSLTRDSSAIFNLAGPESLRLRAIAECIGKILNKQPIFASTSSESGPILVGDTHAMQATLGWTPQTRLADGLHVWLETKQKNAA